jgi:phosphate starvation-inducible PhoH-like protein
MSSNQRRFERRESKRQSRISKRQKYINQATYSGINENVYEFPNPKREDKFRLVKPKNDQQKRALNAIDNHSFTAILGTVGSGKTFLAAAKAMEMLLDPSSPIERIILIRPNIPLGPDIGALPGGIYDKLKPYLIPILDGLEYVAGEKTVKNLIEAGKIEFLPVMFLRGRTWNNSFIIIDEVNNMEERAIAVSMLRKGLDTKVVYCGDVNQIDLKVPSGINLILKLVHNDPSKCPIRLCELVHVVRSNESAYFYDKFSELGIQY